MSDMRSYMNYFCDLHVFFFKAHPWRKWTASFTQMQLFPLHCFLCLRVTCIFTAHISWCFQFSGSILSVGSSFWFFIFFLIYTPIFLAPTLVIDTLLKDGRQLDSANCFSTIMEDWLHAASHCLSHGWLCLPEFFFFFFFFKYFLWSYIFLEQLAACVTCSSFPGLSGA